MTNRLVEIEPKDLPNLLNLYTPDGKKNYITYTAIENYNRWFNQDPNLEHVKVFSLNGDYSDGTFIITDHCTKYVYAYVDTLNESFGRLSQLLHLIDYSEGCKFHSIRTPLCQVIKDALQKKGVEVTSETTLILNRLPKEKALEFDVQPPEDIELRRVTEQHDLEKVNSVWPHRNPNSFSFIQRMAKYNPQIGAFKKDDGTLVSWEFRLPSGRLGVLQTDEKFQRKGYAGLVKKYVSKKIAEMGHDIYAGVFEKNTPSRSLNKKLGFEEVGEFHSIVTKITYDSAA